MGHPARCASCLYGYAAFQRDDAPLQWKARPPWARKGEARVRMGVRAASGRWLVRLSRMREAVQRGPKSWRAARPSEKKRARSRVLALSSQAWPLARAARVIEPRRA